MTETTPVTAIDDALRQCGVTDGTLTPAEKAALDGHGYVVWPSVMGRAWLARVRAAFETAVAEGGRHGRHVHLPWTDPAFDAIYTHPKVLAAVYHVLGRPFRTFPPAGRDPTPGHGLQALHPDWGRMPGEPFHVVTVLWLVDDFTPTNGATRVVPGTHLVPRPVPKALLNPERRHPDQKIIVAEAGSVLLFNGALLHGGTRNDSAGPRRALQCQFRARDVVLPGEAANGTALPDRLSAAARYLLGEDGHTNRGDEDVYHAFRY
jgi:ectoine hydroxylase-related dioxygenase (phytanoyl-CoA dioxygenase family)